MASSTACFLRVLTTAVPLRMRDTVLGDTPAAWATISRVIGPCAWPSATRLARVGLVLGFIGM